MRPPLESTNGLNGAMPIPLLGVASSSYANRGVPKRLRDRSAKPSFTGSTPVSASRSSTRIWVHSSADRAPVSGAGDHGFESHWTHPCNARVVQWLEHLSYTQEVDGSSPSTSTRLRAVFGLAVSRRSCVKWVSDARHGGMSPRDTSGVYLDQCGPRGCSCQGKKEQGQERGSNWW